VLDGAVQGPAGSADLVNIQALTNRLTMDVILRTMFSTPAGENTQHLSAAVQALNEIAMRELFWAVTLPDWLPLPGKALKRNSMRLLDDFVDGHIRARKLLDPTQAPRDDLLAMLLAARDDAPDAAGHSALSDEELRAQCKVMFLAGHDTSATALTWWCWLMAENPQAVQRAREEIERVLGNRDPQPQDMPQLDWLVATIKEALRLYPPAPTLITRRTTADVRVGNALIPKRSMVWVVPWLTHRDPRWFPEPEAFKPERFTADAPPLPRGAWLPFGTGPRVCIGQHFAMLEMTLVATMLLQRYDLAVDPSQPRAKPAFNVTLRPAEAVHLRLTRRVPMR
jgi:cytochrome P450